MVDLTSCQAALKDAYLVAACNQLNTMANPLLTKIKQSTANVYGKQIIKMAPIGLNGGVGAGSETGLLPTANSNTYAEFKTTLKNLYGTIEISDKAIRASESNLGAFVNLLDAEMEGLLTASKFNLGRMLYGDGSGLVATVSSYSSSTHTATLDSVKNIMEGMVLDSYSEDVLDNAGLRVKYVDRVNKTVTFVNAPNTDLVSNDKLYVQGSKDNEITGLGAIFGAGSTLYGLSKTENKWLTPYTSTTSQEISDDVMSQAVDLLAEYSASNIDIECLPGSWPVAVPYRAVYYWHPAYP